MLENRSGIHSCTYFIKYCTVFKDKSAVCDKIIESLIVSKILRLELGPDIGQIHGTSYHFIVIWNLWMATFTSFMINSITLIKEYNLLEEKAFYH